MPTRTLRTLSCLLVLAVASTASAQAALRDPLTPAEADQVRDTSSRLDKRVPLLLSFAAARLSQFEQVRTASPRPPGREQQMYALLREYAAILPEFDDAVDDLASGVINSDSPKHYNVGKVLTPGVASLLQLQAQLHQIQSQSSPSDLASYRFELENCLDVTADSLQNAQQDLAAASAAHAH